MKQLREKYRNQDVEFLLVYVREAHPGEKGFQEYSQHQDLAQKRRYAVELTRTRELNFPVVVDGMDEAVHACYGGLPNMVYVIDKLSQVAYKATWTQAERLDEVLAQLIAGEGHKTSACQG